jgi:hypothetical protein
MKHLLFLVLVACGGGGTDTPVPDAPDTAPACTGATYDNCASNEDCDSQNCHLFSQDAIQVCTQPCDGSNPCPNDSEGVAGECNNRGICKPANNTVCRP